MPYTRPIARAPSPAGSGRSTRPRVQRGPLAATLVTVNACEGDVHRHLRDVQAIIDGADLPPAVKRRALAVFTRLAQAEAAVHGTDVEEVHFHEVGAVDAIVDIVGVCAGLDALGIERLYAGSLPLGEGWTQQRATVGFHCLRRPRWRCSPRQRANPPCAWTRRAGDADRRRAGG